jgi:hypothetical protein
MSLEEYRTQVSEQLKEKDMEEATRILDQRWPEVAGIKLPILAERRHLLGLNELLAREGSLKTV